MNLLADENFPAPVISVLRQQGRDVLAIAQIMPGAADVQVLARAVAEGRALLTLDRDFGDLIFHHGHPAPPVVVLFRLAGTRPADDNRRMLEIVERLDEWLGQFTTVTNTLIRSRPFPEAKGTGGYG
jgi:predicted nuclease of predicted toxin-antitoxin system